MLERAGQVEVDLDRILPSGVLLLGGQTQYELSSSSAITVLSEGRVVNVLDGTNPTDGSQRVLGSNPWFVS